jgi:hypothetical protein
MPRCSCRYCLHPLWNLCQRVAPALLHPVHLLLLLLLLLPLGLI